MATSTRASDKEYLLRNAMKVGYQYVSLLTPPVYAALVLARHGRSALSINRLLRATWLGGVGGGITCGGLAYGWYGANEELLKTRRLQIAYDNNRVRTDDHAIIGALLMGVLVPAVFWNRAHAINLVLGGVGFGNDIGLLTYYGRSFTDSSHKSSILSPS